MGIEGCIQKLGFRCFLIDFDRVTSRCLSKSFFFLSPGGAKTLPPSAEWPGRSGRNRLNSLKYQIETKRFPARNPNIVQNPRKNQDDSKKCHKNQCKKQDDSKNVVKTKENHQNRQNTRKNIIFGLGVEQLNFEDAEGSKLNWSRLGVAWTSLHGHATCDEAPTRPLGPHQGSALGVLLRVDFCDFCHGAPCYVLSNGS